MKRCNNCGNMKPLTEFYIRPAAKDRRYATCKLCKGKRDRKRYNETKGTRDGGVTQVHCENCVFLKHCKHNVMVKDMDWQPYCFVTSQEHEAYQAEYRQEEVTA